MSACLGVRESLSMKLTLVLSSRSRLSLDEACNDLLKVVGPILQAFQRHVNMLVLLVDFPPPKQSKR